MCLILQAVKQKTQVFSDINKNSLRITSYENGDSDRLSVDMLPLDVEIFQNLVDNICRKFNPGKGENLLCFGGCAVFSDEGVLQRVENFLPQSPALLSSWLKVNSPIIKISTNELNATNKS